MAYERVPYTKLDGKQSAAYYDSQSQESWDVFTRMPVALIQSPDSNHFVEWEPKRASSAIGSEPSNPLTRAAKRRSVPVTTPIATPLMVIPVCLFAVGIMWIGWTFPL